MRKMIKPEIKETPSDTPIAIPILITFFAGGNYSDKDGATAGGAPVAVVVDAGVLGGNRKSFGRC